LELKTLLSVVVKFVCRLWAESRNHWKLSIYRWYWRQGVRGWWPTLW